MKVIICLTIILLSVVFAAPVVAAQDIDEKNLPQEVDTRPPPKAKLERDATFVGYVNSKDVLALAGELVYVFNLCEEPIQSFCADEQGILMLGGEDIDKVREMIDKLEEALKTGGRVEIKFSGDYLNGGQRKISGVKMIK